MRRTRGHAENAVSEILGVTMLLAMVVTVIGGVFVLLGPFMDDISDNREWSSGSVAATQLNDRILIAAQTPEGSGLVQQNAQISRSMDSLRDAEIWQVQADLNGFDRTIVSLYGDSLIVSSLNRTASIVHLSDANSNQTLSLTNGSGNFTISGLSGNIFIDIEDIHGAISHRFVEVSLDGIRMKNIMTDGDYSVDLINGGRIEKLPKQPVAVKQFPRLNTDLLLDGTPRVSLILLDLDISSTASRHMTNVHIDSNGQQTLFNEEARNLIIDVEIAGDPSISPQYAHHWTGDYNLFLTGDSVEDYHGFGPYGRLSGLDGMTLYPTDPPFELLVSLQSVVIY
ncbi:MAG: hypothetical protein HOE69_05435 [Euryarchaeota archaeon]|jgi:hypothetical protein|nr:hypothetical protein [Euryarchaeota archaeon]